MRVPLLVKLCHPATAASGAVDLLYDPRSETSCPTTPQQELAATGSVVTATQVDPTSDEASDR